MQYLKLFDVWRSVAGTAISLLAIPAVGALLVALVCGFRDGPDDLVLRIAGFGGLLLAGSLAGRRLLGRPISSSLAVNGAAIVLGWILASLLCAIPFLLIPDALVGETPSLGRLREPLNAWYESVSSVTSCGLTVVRRPTELPPVVQLWRSVCQWIGGVGLAVFAILILDAAELGRSIYKAEARSWQPAESANRTVMRLLLIYSGLTAACGVAFLAAGMTAWESLNHCLIVVSTGGLCVTDDSFSSYSWTIKTIAAIFMLLGALPFAVIYLGVRRRWRQVSKRTSGVSLVVWTMLLLAAFTMAAYATGNGQSFDSVFNIFSGISTCGVSSGNLANFSVTAVWLLIVAMFVGGVGDSTAGGIKLNRVVWMAKVLRWQIRQNLGLDGPEDRPTWNGERVSHEEADQRTSRTVVLGFLFGSTLAVGFLLLRIAYPSDISSDQVIFQATSSLSAVGLSMGLTGAERPAMAKLVEIVLMLAGRLEIGVLLLVPWVLAGRVKLKEHREG